MSWLTHDPITYAFRRKNPQNGNCQCISACQQATGESKQVDPITPQSAPPTYMLLAGKWYILSVLVPFGYLSWYKASLSRGETQLYISRLRVTETPAWYLITET